MTTASTDAVYTLPEGYSSIILSGSIEADGQFPTQPVVGSQILYPTANVTVSAQLEIVANNGNYVLYHVAPDGTTYTVNYTVSNSVIIPTEGTLLIPAGMTATTLTSWNGDAVFPVTPVANSIVIHPSDLTVNPDGTMTGDYATYNVTLLQGGSAYTVAYVISAEPPQTATTSGTYVAPAGHSLVVLDQPSDFLAVQAQWTHTPVTGEQVVWPTDKGTFTSDFNWFGDTEEPFIFYYVKLDGTVHNLTLDPSQLEEVVGPQDVTTTTTLLYPEGWSFVELNEGFDTYLIEHWAIEDRPQAGELIGIEDTNGTITSNFDLITDVESANMNIVVIRNGSAFGGYIDSTGLPSFVSSLIPKISIILQLQGIQ